MKKSDSLPRVFSKKNFPVFAAIIAYLILFLIILFPASFAPQEFLFGKTGDATGAIWTFWVFNHYQNPKPFIDLVNYPQGVDFTSIIQLPFFTLVMNPLTSLLGSLLAYNLFIFLGFFLSAVSMFFLARHFVKEDFPAFVSGLIFSMSPYLFMKATGHLTLLQVWVVVLFVFSMFLLKEKPTILRGFFAGFSLFLTISFETYYFFFSLIFLAVFLAFYLYSPFIDFIKSRNASLLQSLLKKYLIPCIAGIVFFLVLFFTLVFPLIFSGVNGFNSSNPASPGLRGSFYGLVYFSAKPVQFLIPSIYHPLFGGFALDALPKALSAAEFAEGTLFVGFTVLLLAFFALFDRKNKAIAFFLFLIIVVLVLIQGPLLRYFSIFGIGIAFVPLVLGFWLFYLGRKSLAKLFFAITFVLVFVPLLYAFLPQVQNFAFSVTGIAQLKTASPKTIISYLSRFEYFPIPMPSILLYKIVPFFRVYERMIVLLMIGLAVLAGFGVKRIISMQKTNRAKHFAAVAICALIIFEFLPLPPERTTQMLPMPLEYDWLSKQPNSIAVVEYPLSAFPYYAFYQQFHGKKLFNSPDAGFGLGEKEKFVDLSKQETIDYLRSIGVKYLIVHSDFSQLFSQNFPDQQYFQKRFEDSAEALAVSKFVSSKEHKNLSGIKLVKVFGKTFVFEIE